MTAARHEGKVVLVTGAGSGIGRATALRFADEGAERIALVDRRADRLAEVAAEVERRSCVAHQIVAELENVSECRRAVAETTRGSDGRLDVAISNAGAGTVGPFLDLTDDAWKEVIGVNLTASFVIGQSAARAMLESGGVILFTASIAATGGEAHVSHYAASKAGIVNLAKSMALELAPHNIRVNSICPGHTDTAMSDDIVGREAAEESRRKNTPLIPLQRYGTPEDMAAGFSFMASDDASYVTGIDLIIDGGLTARAFSAPDD